MTRSTVVLASAGTGKTYQLTGRYIALIARGEDPGSILATTFTRKAAGEILGRVLLRLARAVRDDKAREELSKQIDLRLSRDDMSVLLARVCDNLHRICVMTIDALFLRMVSAFGAELGTPPGWSILDDELDTDARTEAVEHALASGTPDEFYALLHMLHGGAHGAGVHESILHAVRAAHGAFLGADRNPDPWLSVAPRTDPLDTDLLHAELDAFSKAPLPTKSDGTPNKNWLKARDKLIELASDNSWEALLSAGLGAAAAGDGIYYRKPIPDGMRPALDALVAHAQAHELALLRGRNDATYRLVAAFDASYLEIKRSLGAYRFDDLPRMMLDALPEDLTYLYYRLDARIRHILLDEFQDTSITQFRLIEPMLDEILAGNETGRNAFCVGDDKQSLYAWREAEPELLRGLRGRWETLEALQLSENWRSSPAVLDTVNTVFSNLNKDPALADSAPATRWTERYQSHTPSKPNEALPGMVRLVEADGFEEDMNADERREAAARDVAQRVQHILEASPNASVAVLTRFNKPIPLIIHELDRLEIEASGEGGNPVSDSPAVSAAIAMLQFADHPGDTAAVFQVAHSPLARLIGLDRYDDTEHVSQIASHLRRRFSQDGLARTLSDLARDARAEMSERCAFRFDQLVSLADRFERDAALRPGLLARIARARPVETPSGAPVRVMTVHKAKGLEFDAVVLTELERAWSPDHRDVLVGRPEPLAPPDTITTWPKQHLRDAHARLAELHEAATERAIGEELCVLYVAMTRAKHNLEIVLEPGDPKQPSSASLLRTTIAGADEPLYEHSVGDWTSVQKEPAARGDPETIGIALAPRRGTPLARAKRRGPSARSTTRGADLVSGVGRARGTVLHKFFELVEWSDLVIHDDDTLAQEARRLGVRDPEPMIEHFRHAMSSESIANVLARSRYPDDPSLWRERPFALSVPDTDGTPTLVQGRIDRLVAWTQDGVLHAEVIDFKTDRAEPDDVEQLTEHYTEQLGLYRQAAAALTGADPARVRATLVFTDPGIVVTI